jgi:hypothetical protein
MLDARTRPDHRVYERDHHLADLRSFLEQPGELILGDIFPVIRRAQVRLCLVQASICITQELDKLPLCSASKAFSDVGANRLGRIVDLLDEPAIVAKCFPPR